ncbi:outer membrane lipoprotein LolB [Vibrio sinaloensis DSM 21326]|uniref:Outer-membrane lipoprotein LolB n=1 Tax=Vibrio sinaloensis DSM 21326 TaxID=945550 RepID=E8M4H2_PHOS4|nr:lipoprotein insertase outer membrane protein LolB [Vibrio sinaloensis]EGA71060.1 outer membrane lipoprotein LolB [Vibrio sinaloensis DSM 21326]
MTTKLRPFWISLLAALLLSGCASIESSQTNVEWQTHQQRLASISQYQSSGKLGYISPEQRQSLNFRWQHAPQSSQLRLTTFLGQTALNLKITPTGAVVDTYDDKTYTSTNAESLIYQLTGLTIPVEQLHDWLLGRPTSADGYLLNETNTLATLRKEINGQTWQLDYLNYKDVLVDGVALPLPQKLKLKQQDTSINIVISKWDLKK